MPFQSGDPNTNVKHRRAFCAPISSLFAPSGNGMEGGVSIVSACKWEGGYPLPWSVGPPCCDWLTFSWVFVRCSIPVGQLSVEFIEVLAENEQEPFDRAVKVRRPRVTARVELQVLEANKTSNRSQRISFGPYIALRRNVLSLARSG